MSSLQPLGEFIGEEVKAAAEEICRYFEGTIARYEAELGRQRRLLDISRNPQIQMHNIALPLYFLNVGEDFRDNGRISDVMKEEPEPAQVKEEHEEWDISQAEEPSDLKLETYNFIAAAARGEDQHREPSPIDHEFPVQKFHATTCWDQEESNLEESKSSTYKETRCKSHRDDKELAKHKCSSSNPSGCEEHYQIESCSHSQEFKKTMQTSEVTNHSTEFTESHCRVRGKRKNVTCDECGKVCRKKSELEKHMRAHTGERPFSCDQCGKRLSHKSTLMKHMRIHMEDKPFSCEECGRKFVQKPHLLTHMRTHTGEKPFSCEECGRAFSGRTSLLRHVQTHKGEKPFSCEECGKHFSQTSSLRVHMGTHAGKKKFPCRACGKRFSRRFHLKAHLKTHTIGNTYPHNNGIVELSENLTTRNTSKLKS